MQITENISNHYYNTKNNIHINRCHWCKFEKCIWPEQAANLYKNLLKMPSKLKKADLHNTKEFV